MRVAVAAAGLCVAAATDWRTREVPDGVWYALGAAALALMALDFSATFGGIAWVLVVPVALLFVVAITGGEILPLFPGVKGPPEEFEPTPEQRRTMRINNAFALALIAGALLIFVAAPGLDLGRQAHFLAGPEAQAYSVSIMFGVAIAMYATSLLAGGADAKGMIALSALFPHAPVLPGLPLIQPPAFSAALIPFSLAAFFNGAILLVLARVPVFPVLGLRAGRVKFPESFLGYEKPLERVNPDREWLMGRVVDGEFRRVWMGSHASHSEASQREALEWLRAHGVKREFVTPKIPFMVFLLGGFAVLVLVTSPLYLVGR